MLRYFNNQDNPLNTSLDYVNGAGAGVGLSTISLLFKNLAAGDYTLILGGQSSPSGPHGAYSVLFDVQPTPLPGAIWLMGSALLGFIGMNRVRRA